jgi:hypothetical protein
MKRRSLAVPAATPWKSYVPVIAATTTAPTKGSGFTLSGRWRQLGDTLEVRIEYQHDNAGAAGNGEYLFSLPPGYVVDSNKITIDSTLRTGICGTAASGTSSGNVGWCKPYTSTQLAIVSCDADTPAFLGSARNGMNNGNATYVLHAFVPVRGRTATRKV